MKNDTESLTKLQQSFKVNKYTAKKIANWLGVSKQTVYNWLHQKVMPHKDHLDHLKKLTGLTTDEILDND